MSERRFTKGSPQCFGLYDCNTESGRKVVVDYDPIGDSEIHPHGELLNEEIVEFRRIPGQNYKATLPHF